MATKKPLTDAPWVATGQTPSGFGTLSVGTFVQVHARNEYFWARVSKVTKASADPKGVQMTCVVDNNTLHSDLHGYSLGDSFLVRGSQVYAVESEV